MAYTTFVPGNGYFYTADALTEPPADLLDPGADFKSVGNTPIEDIITFDSEGGEENVLATLQNKRHRVVADAIIESFQFGLHDLTADSYELYYGENLDTTSLPGWYGPDGSAPQAVERAFLMVLIDGNSVLPLYVPKARIYRGDNLQISGTDALVSLPIKVTPIDVEGKQPYYLRPVEEITGS